MNFCSICRNRFNKKERRRTNDHVVPRCFYNQPFPNNVNLLTRHACQACQNVLKPREERLRNLFARAIPTSRVHLYSDIVKKASTSSLILPPMKQELIVKIAEPRIVVPRTIMKTGFFEQSDLSAVFYKIVRGLFHHTYGREMAPTFHRVGMLPNNKVKFFTDFLISHGYKVRRQESFYEFDWLHGCGKIPEDGIWLFKVFDAVVVYAGTGEFSKINDIEFAKDVVVGGLPEW